MAVMVSIEQATNTLLGEILIHAKQGERVMMLTEPGGALKIVTRLRTALSRSRQRNRKAGRKIEEFTLHHSVFPYTQDAKRHDCLVMWIERTPRHVLREHLDDLLEN